MELSLRLQAVVEACVPLPVWADVGCDHGQVSAALVRTGKAQRVIATDVSGPSLDKARALALALGLCARIECRVGDGLAALSLGEAQGVVLAGMGTPLMCSILARAEQTAHALQWLVLSPNNYEDRLRAYLTQNGWKIIAERMVREANRFYPVMTVRPGQTETYSQEELLAGRHMLADDALAAWLEHRMQVLSGICAQLDAGSARYTELAHLRGKYMQIFQKLFAGPQVRA